MIVATYQGCYWIIRNKFIWHETVGFIWLYERQLNCLIFILQLQKACSALILSSRQWWAVYASQNLPILFKQDVSSLRVIQYTLKHLKLLPRKRIWSVRRSSAQIYTEYNCEPSDSLMKTNTRIILRSYWCASKSNGLRALSYADPFPELKLGKMVFE